MNKNLVKAVTFLLVFCLLFTIVNSILIFKQEDGIPQMQGFYKQPAGTIDVLCMGSSHIFANINPAILYENYGIAAYDLAGSMQPMWNTYYVLRDSLKYQQPKLIILDVFRLTEGFEYSKESKVVKNTYGMRFSIHKIESIQESLENPNDTKEIMRHLIGFPTYKERIWEISYSDLKEFFVTKTDDKGYRPLFDVETYTVPEVSEVIETKEIEKKTKNYFLKILELAEENDIPVLLMNSPYIINEDDKKIYNTLEAMLAAGELPGQVEYLDFNDLYNEVGLDFNKDFADYDHLNVSGCQKFNEYLGHWIVENYTVSDRRGQNKFKTYEINLKNWKETLANF